MKQLTDRSAEWVYRGVWHVLSDLFRVPDRPPVLPAEAEDGLRVFHPSRRYLTYMKVLFWIFLVLSDLVIGGLWVLIFANNLLMGWLLLGPALFLAIAPDILTYIAIHLRYDTIWYGLSDRGLYIRRGIVVIQEHTITLENIQNIALKRGPIEQLFGLSTLVVETAATSTQAEGASMGSQSVMVGLADPDAIKDILAQRIRENRGVGLGDDRDDASNRQSSAQDVELLEEILAELRLA